MCLFISISHVNAFDIDMDKISVEAKSEKEGYNGICRHKYYILNKNLCL